MARIRTIKPEFWDDQKLASISRDARLTFIGLWNHSDDFGVVKAHSRWLQNKIFPYDDTKPAVFETWLEELIKIRAVIKFTSNGEDFFYIRNFSKHQNVCRPNEKFRNPCPPESVLNDHRTLNEDSLSDQRKLNSGMEWNGMEWNILCPPATSVTESPPQEKNGHVPYQEIQEAFNSILGEHLPQVRHLTEARRKKIKARWNTDEKTSTLEWWKGEFFPMVADSDFLTGKNGKWLACSFDWIMKAENFIKIREGNFNRQ